MKLEKNIFLFAALIGLAVSVTIPAVPLTPLQPYDSDFTHEPWAYQVVPTPNAQTVTYAVSDDPRCKTACYKGEFCKIIRGNAVCTPYCGDGIVARGEHVNGACDDGNQNPFDGCNKCKVTRNWFCGNKRDPDTKLPIIGAVSVCSWLCGDGKVDTVTGEQCDDGNNINGDGCSSLCRIVPSWSCPLPASGKSVCTPKCGDGRRVSYELDEGKCDDGNNNDNDGCSATCVVEKHWACRGVPSICTPSCPSAEWNAYAQEQCDNGQVIDGNGAVIPDGCDQSDNKCVPNSGWTCTNIAGRPSVCKTKCGDGILAGNQECDDNDLVNGDGCNRQCKIQLGWKCSPTDLANINSTSKCLQICGDGRRVGKQALPRGCDDANNDGNDGCVGCQTQRLFTCVNLFPNTPSKCENLCGNGRFNPIVGEECDTGAATGVGCQSDCTVTPGWACEIGAAYGPTPCYECGNGIVDVTETCDIGTNSSPGCVGCVLQETYTCSDTACTSTAP